MRFVVGNSTVMSIGASTVNFPAGLTVTGGSADLSSHKIVNLADGQALQDGITVNQRIDPMAASLGYLQWNMNPQTVTNSLAATAGVVYLTGIWLPPGKVISNIVLNCVVASSGSAPTSFFVGIAKPDGTMLKQSTDQKSLVTGQGPIVIPLSATYTTNTSDSQGFYYIVVLQVGSWGTTQPTFARGSSNAPLAVGLSGGTRPFAAGATTGQTALPANGSAIVGGFTTSNAFAMFVGVT